MVTKFVNAKSLCTPSKLPASDYVINPYIGCTHRCIYCYACFMGRFTNHTEKWGTYLEPKRYRSYKLPKNLDNKTILIGSVTDAYNPAEKKYKLMLNILQALETCSAHIEILTKSNLVLRDIELLKRIPDISVGISLSNLNETDRTIIESGASSVGERIDALKQLHEEGIKTYLFVAPYLPGITNLSELYKAVENTIDYMCVENLNLRGAYKQSMLDVIDQLHPEVSCLWKDIFINKKGDEYWKKIEEEIIILREKIPIPVISYMYHEKIKKI